VVVSPRKAGIPGGRLTGIIWPVPPTQVAHYAAVTFGMVVVLWLCGRVSGRFTAWISVAAVIMLVLTHTRTALLGSVTGILVAGFSLFLNKARVRKAFVITGAVLSVTVITLSSILTAWLSRGQSTQELSSFTGRTPVWEAVVAAPRNWFDVLFGAGLSNNSFGGFAIDSNWLASYADQGLIGASLIALMLVYVFIAAYFQPPGVRRALPLFLVTYCLIASFTETGLAQPSSYMVELTLGASMLVPTLADSAAA
jgi:hypothetical protein